MNPIRSYIAMVPRGDNRQPGKTASLKLSESME